MEKKKVLKSSIGKVFITSGFNNTTITITDSEGQTLCWSTPGAVGFSGSRRSTPFAASAAASAAAKKAVEAGLKEVAVFVKGPGMGRDAAIKSLKTGGLQVTSIADVTPVPHNGCRPKKRRRV
ncbi:MAG: 30S ribosomal protein S11 [Patescibacteria group bacterium]